MIKKDYILTNKNGLTSRLSSFLVSFANKFDCDITLYYKKEKANLKSIMNVMALIIKCNEPFSLSCDGTDEEEAINSIDEFLKSQDIVK